MSGLYKLLESPGPERIREAARLADVTSWLLNGDDECIRSATGGRGAEPRALASAALFWIMLIEHARGNAPRPSAKECWEAVGSSRASFYRATAIWGHCVVGVDHRLILRGRVQRRRVHSSRVYYHSMHLVLLDGYKPVDHGFERLYIPQRLLPAELLLLPAQHNGRRRALSTWRSVRLKINVTSLLEEVERRFGKTFTTDDVADLLHSNTGSVGQLLRQLAEDGFIERVRNGVWRIRETEKTGDAHS